MIFVLTGSSVLAQAEDRIVYGLAGEVSGIDPHVNNSAELGIVLRQVYDTLIYRHPDDGSFVPGLATEWQVSDDGLEYTFALRNDVVFHDGTPFDAHAVAANIDRIRDPQIASQKAFALLGPFARYEILDDYTIKLVFTEPYGALLDSLSQVYLGIASPAALQEYAEHPLRYQFHQVGTGPYEFVEYLPGDRIIIRKNLNYNWGPPFYERVIPNPIEEIEFRFYRNAEERAGALERGEVQIMSEVLPFEARVLAGTGNVGLSPQGIPGQPMQLYMNVNKSPTDQLAVRQALIYATNREAIVDSVFQGLSSVAYGPLAATTDYYNNAVFGMYDFDAIKAQALLATAGYRDTNGDTILDKDGEPLVITILVPPWGQYPETIQLLVQQWREIGIIVEIQPVSGNLALRSAIDGGNYHLVAGQVVGLDPAFMNEQYITESFNNLSGYANPNLDAILFNASQQIDTDARRQLYDQAQAMIMNDAVILPIRDQVNVNAYSANIQNLQFDAYGLYPILNNVSINMNTEP